MFAEAENREAVCVRVCVCVCVYEVLMCPCAGYLVLLETLGTSRNTYRFHLKTRFQHKPSYLQGDIAAQQQKRKGGE
jgi:hypothetical protein